MTTCRECIDKIIIGGYTNWGCKICGKKATPIEHTNVVRVVLKGFAAL